MKPRRALGTRWRQVRDTVLADLSLSIGQRIKAIREARGWSMSFLGRRLGVSNKAVEHWERGTHEPGSFNLYCLARIFECSMDALYGPKRWLPLDEQPTGRRGA